MTCGANIRSLFYLSKEIINLATYFFLGTFFWYCLWISGFCLYLLFPFFFFLVPPFLYSNCDAGFFDASSFIVYLFFWIFLILCFLMIYFTFWVSWYFLFWHVKLDVWFSTFFCFILFPGFFLITTYLLNCLSFSSGSSYFLF